LDRNSGEQPLIFKRGRSATESANFST